MRLTTVDLTEKKQQMGIYVLNLMLTQAIDHCSSAICSATAPLVCRSAPGHLIDTSAETARRLSHIYLLRLSRQRS